MEILEGKVLEIIFKNEDNGYMVATFKDDKGGENTIVGCMPTLNPMERIQVMGSWKKHDTYGSQFEVSSFLPLIPNTKDGIVSYLASGLIKGVGEKMAQRIVDKFEEATLDIIQNSPHRLIEVDGVGQKKADAIYESFNEGKELRNLIINLSPYGITPSFCLKIFKKYKHKSLDIVFKNPYKLAEDIKGIGFKIADKIGMSMGIQKESKDRIKRGIIYVLSEGLLKGHTYLPIEELIVGSKGILEVAEESVGDCIVELAMEGEIQIEKWDDGRRVYLLPYYISENNVCKKLIELLKSEIKELKIDIEDELEDIQRQEKIVLAKNQKQAVIRACEEGVVVVTGGPGTGKTTTINTIIGVLKRAKMKIVLAAPTGRAAKRMTETTKEEAKTIHRLLEMGYNTDGEMVFMKNEEDTIKADVIIVDEVSMVDIVLMYSLLRSIKPGTRVIFVGDSDQLPSVGAGNVLRDMINSGVIPVERLDEIFRQAKESMIVVNAHRINSGKNPLLNQKGKDFFFIKREKDEDIMAEIMELVGSRLPKYYKLDGLKDMQILSPMRKGNVGVFEMNANLQNVLNPPSKYKTEEKLMKRVFRVGDKVMQIKNNYSKVWESEDGKQKGEGVFNGDIGYLYYIDKEEKNISVIFDEFKIVKYEYSELDELEHSFCTTIHKSQGSEFPVVIMPIGWAPPMLLMRNLLYTAVTRAKKLVVLVGNPKFLSVMVRNNKIDNRNSSLEEKLKRFISENMIDVDMAED